MKEILSHPFVLTAITFFVVVVGTILVLLGGTRESYTIDTSAWNIIKETSSAVEDILDSK